MKWPCFRVHQMVTTSSWCCVFLVFLQCSLPSNHDPLRWKIALSLPMVKDTISVSQHLNEIAIKNGTVDTTALVTALYTDSTDFSVEIGDHLRFNDVQTTRFMGPLRLQNVDSIREVLLFPFTGPVTVSQSFQVASGPVAITHVYSVTFDESCQELSLVVSNQSAVACSTVTVTLRNNSGTVVASTSTPLLAAHQTKSLMMSVADRLLEPPVIISVSGVAVGGTGSINAGEGIVVSFQLNAMTASAARLLDSCIVLNALYHDSVGVSDSVAVDYCDIDTLAMRYQISCKNGITASVIASMAHTWDRTFAENKNIVSCAAIGSKATAGDSLLYIRNIIVHDTIGQSATTVGQTILKNVRLFPVVQQRTMFSIIPCVYVFMTIPANKVVTVNKNDTIAFNLQSQSPRYRAFSGTTRFPLSHNKSNQSIAVTYPWRQSVIDSIKGKLRFSRCSTRLAMAMIMPDSSRIDSLRLRTKIFTVFSSGDTARKDTAFISVMPRSIYRFALDVSSLINAFPQTVSFTIETTIPARSRIRMVNRFSGSIPVPSRPDTFPLTFKTRYTMSVPFITAVTDSIVTTLESLEFAVPHKEYAFLQKIINPRYTFESNLSHSLNGGYATLYGLAASKRFKRELMALAENEIDSSVVHTQKGRHFFHFLGGRGLTVGPATESVSQTSLYDSASLAKLLSDDTVSVRLRLLLPTASSIILTKKDYIALWSCLHIEGIGSMDSLTTF
ncbi:MAG: hypothetical protein JW795_02070 [Chitinivibrionales bacterium]|nr:hypothetical protein [Chitinivibrionales bacterium]